MPADSWSIDEFLRTADVGHYVEMQLRAGATVTVEGTAVDVDHPRSLRGVIASLAVQQSADSRVETVKVGMSQYLLDVVARGGPLRSKAHQRPSLVVEIGPTSEVRIVKCTANIPQQFTAEVH